MKSTYRKWVNGLRIAGILEGISFLTLLGIAMPLKYVWHEPLAVKYTGWAHGVLFVSYIYLAFQVFSEGNKPGSWLAKAALAAVVPFGTFVFDRQLKSELAGQ